MRQHRHLDKVMTTSGPQPRVSVIMPVLRPHAVYFLEAVKSILGQTIQDFELIVVEDPSPSSAEPLLRRLADPRIRYHRNARRTSLAEQRNCGLRMARSDLVAFLDADDVAEVHRLDRQLAFLEAHPDVGVLGSQLRIIDQIGRVLGYRSYPLEHEAIVRAMCHCVPLAQPSVMLRKGLVLEAGGYQFQDYPSAEDYELWSRLVQRGVCFANHPEPLLRYRIHPEQMKRTHLRTTIRAILRVKQMHWSARLSWYARARMWAEWAMLGLPPWLVFRVFLLIHCRPRLRSATDGRSPEVTAMGAVTKVRDPTGPPGAGIALSEPPILSGEKSPSEGVA